MNDDVIGRFCERRKKILRGDYDDTMVATGPEGIGKTACAVYVCKNIDSSFGIENVVYSQEEIEDKIFNLPMYSAVLIDEGMEAFYKRDWMTKDRKRLNKIFSEARQLRLFFAFCAPRFFDLDEYFRNWRLTWWFHVTSRGNCNIAKIDRDPFTPDPWNLGDKKRFMKKNYYGWGHFPDFPEGFKDEYVRRKEEAFRKWGEPEEIMGKMETIYRKAYIQEIGEQYLAVKGRETIRDFCKRKGLKERNFYIWRDEYGW